MTNYRIEMHKNEIPQFKFCFTCGSPIIKTDEGLNEDGEEHYQCSKSWVHLQIWAKTLEEDENEEIKFV